jgi:hypothetical protein
MLSLALSSAPFKKKISLLHVMTPDYNKTLSLVVMVATTIRTASGIYCTAVEY